MIKPVKNEKAAEIVGLAFGDGSLTTRKNERLRFQMRGHIEENPLTPTITLNAEVAEPGQMRKFIPKRLVEETSVTNALSLSGCEGSNIQKGCESPFLRIY